MANRASPIPAQDATGNVTDYELAAEHLGPSARMIALEVERGGGIYFQIGRREPRRLHLPPRYSLRQLVAIDMIQLVALLDLRTRALTAVASLTASGTNVALLGQDWGRWVDETGGQHESPNMVEQFTRWRSAVAIDPGRHLLGFEFLINIYNPDVFPRDIKLLFREGQLHHSLSLRFKFPTGTFHSGQLQIRDARTDRIRSIHELEDFPLRLPEVIANTTDRPLLGGGGAQGENHSRRTAPRAGSVDVGEDLIAAAMRRRQARQTNGTATQGTQGVPASDKTATPESATRDAGGGSARGRGKSSTEFPSPGELDPALVHPALRGTQPGTGRAEAKPRPIPKTEHLSTHEMLAMISTETDPDRRWRMIEPNLMLGRAERAYPLILNYADLIAERTREWPGPRLKLAFANQPGAVLIAIMHGWSNNQVLAVAEENAEAARVLEWLAEREIERLLPLKTEREPTSALEARRLLNVDKNADANTIKKVWRTLLGFMNADHGRSQERAIHRRKDEIAKHLQSARNLLIKNS